MGLYGGAGEGCRHLVLINLGTGVGVSAIVENIPLRGAHGQGGCLSGHFTVVKDGRTCTCGSKGCVEAEASGWALPQIAQEDEGFTSSLLSQETVMTVESISRLAASGDELAVRLWNHAVEIWSIQTANLIYAYDPEKIIFVGGIMKNADTILPPITECLKQRLWNRELDIPLTVGSLGNKAALFGIAVLAGMRKQETDLSKS